MTKEKKTEIKVGITVFVALIIFGLLFGWAKNYRFDSNKNQLKIKFHTVAGLEVGDLVSVNGVRKGIVETISSDQNSALVEIEFNEKVDLREDATFSIMMLDLMGGKKIEIFSGNSSEKLDITQIQEGKFSGDISTAMATLSSVENDLVAVISELKLSLNKMNELLDNKDFINNLNSSVSNLKILTNNLNSMIIENREAINSTITSTKQLTEKTNLLINNNSEKFETILSTLDTTLISTQELISKLNTFGNQVFNKENNVGKLIYDEDLLNNLKTTFEQVKELTTIINEQLKSGGLEVKADVDLF